MNPKYPSIQEMIQKLQEAGRTPIVPAPNRWFADPVKHPFQQKMIERVLAQTNQGREGFPSGSYINPQTGEPMDFDIMHDLGVAIDPNTGRPMMSGIKSDLTEIDPKYGSVTKSNLVRKGLFKHEGGDELLKNLAFLATIEKSGKGHHYGLSTHYASPAELVNTMTGKNPTLRPHSRGDIFGVGDEVGRISIQGKHHPVYEKLLVAPAGSDVQGKKLHKVKGGVAHMDKGGDLSKYKDPKSTKIEDWNWREMKDVRKDVPITEIPDYIQGGYGEFMNEQLAKAKAGQLSPRDLLKAFTITQSSIGRGGLSHATATKTGMKLPNTGGEVRPEGAFAEWLGSPMGQKYLNAAEQGLIDPVALSDIQQKFSPFGKHNQLIDQMAYAAHTIPGMARGMNQAVAGSTEDYRDWAEKLRGIAGAKSGFIGSMLGRGDLPTLDARQLNLHTLPADVGAGSIMARGKGKGAREAVDRLAARQYAMRLGIDPSLLSHYQHLAHHAVWDAVGKNKTTHDDLMRAMRGYAKGGKVTHAHHLEIEERPL